MTIRMTVVTCFLVLTSAFTQVQSTAHDEVLQATRSWLQNVNKGDRAGLNAIMDPRCIITTPAGDVLTKERLVPDDPAQAVQRLPAFDLDGPMVRLYGDTAVLWRQDHEGRFSHFWLVRPQLRLWNRISR